MTGRLKVGFFLLIIVMLWTVPSVYGHGDLHERIVATTQEIKSYPDSAFLYLKRGELFYQHIEYKKSIRDFKACSKLGYPSPRLNLGFARSYEGLGKLKSAEASLNEILANDAQDVRALRLLGRILFKMKRYEESAISYEKVIQYADKTFTENYLEASLAWEKWDGEESLKKAQHVIHQGIKDLGELMLFYDRLVDLSLTENAFDSAIAYQTKIVEQSNRKERAYYQRALIQLKATDKIAAKSDLLKSMEAIEKLPPRIKNNKAILDLKSSIDQLLISL